MMISVLEMYCTAFGCVLLCLAVFVCDLFTERSKDKKRMVPRIPRHLLITYQTLHFALTNIKAACVDTGTSSHLPLHSN